MQGSLVVLRSRRPERTYGLVVVGLILAGLVAVGLASWRDGSPASSTSEQPRPGAHLEFLSFGHDVYDFVPGSAKTIGGLTLRLTADADFQVVDGAGAVLWHTDTSAPCDGNCRVVLQGDGNLVLRGPAGTLWESGTSTSPGATMIFQPRESYLTIRDADYDVVWTSNGDDTTGATAMLGTALVGPRAVPVQAFLDSLAVNTHMDQYERDVVTVHDKLDFLGVRTIRDHYSEDGSLRENYSYLAERGVRFNMLHYSSDVEVLIRDAEVMAGLPNDALVAVEGPNEINNFPFTCDGSTWQRGWPNGNGPAAQCFMERYHRALKANPRLSSIPLYHLTGNISVVDPDRYGLLGLAGQADYGNIHPYPKPDQQPRNALLRELGSSYLTVPPSKAVITETGYATSEVSERAQALYYLNLYLDAFQSGFHKTYVYELTDNQYETFGFFDTADRPKLSATAMHNLTTVLADTGSPREGTLNHTLTGMPSDAHSLVMQRSTGAFNLVLWDERPIWNGADVTPAAATVTVDLDRTFSRVTVHQPLGGATATQQFTGVSSVDLQLAGEPLVLELVP
jgi:hypothetical protein